VAVAKFLSFLAYVWRVLVNLIMLLVLGGVIHEAHSPFEITVVASLGLIYVTIRSIGIGQAMMFVNFATGVDTEFTRIRRLFGDPDIDQHEEDASALRKLVRRRMGRFYVDVAFLSIAFFICLYWLLNAGSYRTF
jgi:hypothetical protein